MIAQLCALLRKTFPVLLLFSLLFALCGQLGLFLCFLLAVALHESGHALLLNAVGVKKSQMRLTPFSAKIPLEYELTPTEELAVALGGPLASVLGALMCAGLLYFFKDSGYLLQVMNACIVLACVNILPALPLDGGRVLHSLLRMCFGNKTASAVCVGLGVTAGGALMALFVYALTMGVINVSALALSLLMITGALGHKKQSAVQAASAAMSRKRRLREQGKLSGQSATVSAKLTPKQAMLITRGAAIIYIVDDDMRLLGTMGEGDLLNAAAKNDSAPLSALFATARRQVGSLNVS